MPFEEDFAPDPEGLQQALRRLIEVRSRAGSAHVDSPLVLDLPRTLPEAGVGGPAALERLAGPGLEQATRLDHPGFLAHMDPPTPWMTWAAAGWAAAMNQNLLHPDTGRQPASSSRWSSNGWRPPSGWVVDTSCRDRRWRTSLPCGRPGS